MKTSKEDFIAEAEDLLEEINNALSELQNAFDPEVLNSVFRYVHTLKGLAGLFGLKGITDLSHSLESLLDDLRLGRIEFTDSAVSLLFFSMDVIKRMIIQVSGEKEIEDVTDYVMNIEEFRNSAESTSDGFSMEGFVIDPSILKVLSEYEEHRLKSNVGEGRHIYLVKSVFDLADFTPALEVLSANLKTMGEIIATLPRSEGIPDGSIGFMMLFGSEHGRDAIREKAGEVEVQEITSSREPETPRLFQYGPRDRERVLKSASNTVRVDIGKLDKILNTLGELSLAKGAVVRIGGELAGDGGYHPLTLDIRRIAQTLTRKIAEMQDYILELRMVPFSQIFTRLAQVVRRYTAETGKEIHLELFGEDTEVDKLLAEEIIDPLVHIVRNAIDHGIEPPDTRTALGKDTRGIITVRALSKGRNVVVTVQDDGSGIEGEKIFSRAVERGLLRADEDMEPKEKVALIFLTGLSTKEEASEVSGRGMGMDIVKERINSVGGFVEVDTETGVGTTFTLSLPITVAILRALIVQVASERFVIPINSISETLSVRSETIQRIEGKEVLDVRGELVPLLRIARVFKLEDEPLDEYFLVVVGSAGRRLGLLVDGLSDQTEIIIKPLGEHLQGVRGLAGAAEIGRHEIVLVLDVEAMMEEAFSRPGSTAG